MTRKRCKRRPVPVRSVPIAFGFPDDVKFRAELQARTALDAVLGHTGTPDDVALLLRIALYATGACEQMLRGGSVEADGLADVAEALNDGERAVLGVVDRLQRTGRVGTAGPEREPLRRLVDAYVLLFRTATRRESIAASASIPSP